MNTTRNIWFQRADGKSTSFAFDNQTNALKVFQSINWPDQWKKYNDLKLAHEDDPEFEEEPCKPNFFLEYENGNALKLVCKEGLIIEVELYVFYETAELGESEAFKAREPSLSFYENVPISRANKLITLSFAGNLNALELELRFFETKFPFPNE